MSRNIFYGVTLNGSNTTTSWRACILNDERRTIPEPKVVEIEVPGMSGKLDLTESLTGDVPFKNRTLRLQCVRQSGSPMWETDFSTVIDNYHGKMVRAIFDDDPNHFYYGRATITEAYRSRVAGFITIVIDADPYRYENALTTNQFSVNGVLDCEVTNTRKWVCPDIYASQNCELILGGRTYQVTGGQIYKIRDFILKEGVNTFRLSGTADFVMQYRRGKL